MTESALNPTSSGKKKFQETMVICGGARILLPLNWWKRQRCLSETLTLFLFKEDIKGKRSRVHCGVQQG